MKRRTFAVVLTALFALAVAGPSLANTGYEGQPGNQSSNNGGGNTGYEGQLATRATAGSTRE